MNQDQLAIIENAIEQIELEGDFLLDLSQLAREIGVSKYYLHHLFKALTGKPLMTYIRGRRLSKSIFDLLHTQLKIIDIANKHHFEHEQSYIRAFKQKFQITPAQYRKVQYELAIEQKVDIHSFYYIGQGLTMKPRMCIKPTFHIQGIEKEIVHSENLIDQGANKLARLFKKEYLPFIEEKVNPDVYIGFVRYTDAPEYSNFYVPSVEVKHREKVESPFVQYTIEAQEYAVFTYVGLHSPYEISFGTLKTLYDYIDLWLQQTAYNQTNSFHFEKMDLNITSDQYCEMNIYIPIDTAISKSNKVINGY